MKTNMKKYGEYLKKDISKCHDHEEWLSNNHRDDARLIISEPTLPVPGKAYPSATLQIVEIDPMRVLFASTKAMYDNVKAGDQTRLDRAFHFLELI